MSVLIMFLTTFLSLDPEKTGSNLKKVKLNTDLNLIQEIRDMLISNLFKIVFILFAVSGAFIHKLANLALSRLMMDSSQQLDKPAS